MTNKNKGKLNGISLFSGYAGIDIALNEWVKTILYCEIEKYPQGVLVSRMEDESIDFAPIWNDVTTLDGTKFRGLVDIVFGGFPCQDISVAGNGAGLDGKRSGLFYEFIRILSESKAPFAFFENVPAIETRGAERVQEALAELGFTAKWLHLSASEVGANHRRERWFCLAANTNSNSLWSEPGRSGRKNRQTKTQPGHHGEKESMADSESVGDFGVLRNIPGKNEEELKPEEQYKDKTKQSPDDGRDGGAKKVANTDIQRQCGESVTKQKKDSEELGEDYWRSMWKTEPRVGRVAHGSVARAHRIKALGNGVVPLQVKTAFEILMGIKP